MTRPIATRTAMISKTKTATVEYDNLGDASIRVETDTGGGYAVQQLLVLRREELGQLLDLAALARRDLERTKYNTSRAGGRPKRVA